MEGLEQWQSQDGGFGYCSKGCSQALAMASGVNGRTQVGSSAAPEDGGGTMLQSLRHVIGVGCTSALVSSARPRQGRKSKAFISIRNGVGVGMSYSIVLKDGIRSRREEEDLVGQLVLQSILKAIVEEGHEGKKEEEEGLVQVGEGILMRDDQVSCTEWNYTPSIQSLAEEIIHPDQTTSAALLIPSSSSSTSHVEDGETMTSFQPMASVTLPSDPLIFPGSFNPPHIGHAALAHAAVQAMTRKRISEYQAAQQGGESNESTDLVQEIWNAAAPKEGPPPPTLLFELSLTNADKPAMEATEAVRRSNLFLTLQEESAEVFPSDWGVLLTSAPLFLDKVRLLNPCIAPSASSFGTNMPLASPPRTITFVIGTDTMVRILNPKYYGGEMDNMIAAVREMQSEGVHFVVGGRVEQMVDEVTGRKSSTFVTGEEALEGLPVDVKDIFTIIKEEDFRVDISSTELRAREQGKVS